MQLGVKKPRQASLKLLCAGDHSSRSVNSVSALSFLQYLDTVGSVIGKTSGPHRSMSIISKGSLLKHVEEENQHGGPADLGSPRKRPLGILVDTMALRQ